MDRRSIFRTMSALGVAVTALVVSVAPATAFYEAVNTGNTGFATFPEYPGARCIFENNPGQLDDELDKVKAAQFWTHGPYAQDSKILVRFQFQRNTPPHSDGVFTNYYVTPNIIKYANEQDVAFFGPRTYRVPENTNAQWRVRILINYYNLAGNTIVGKIRGITEVYRHQLSGQPSYDIGSEGGGPNGYCRKEFH